VLHVPGTSRKTVDYCLGKFDVSVQPDGSSAPELSDLRPELVLDSTTRLRTSTISTESVTRVAGSGPSHSSEDLYNHIQCLIDGLPDDLTAEQCTRCEAFIKGRSNVFSHSALLSSIIQHCIDTSVNTPHFEHFWHHPGHSCPSLMIMSKTCSGMTSLSQLHHHGVPMW